jgi:TatD DNase family protein
MIDVGVNLTNSRFNADRAAVIQRARLAGIKHLVITGTSIEHSELAINFCQHMPHLLSCTVGIHPHDADQAPADYIAQLAKLAQHHCVKAIGECGLDYNRNFSSPENQRNVFMAQLELAKRLQLPVFLHQRDAFSDWLDIIRPFINQIPAFIAHCFTGNENELMQCLALDMYIGITGWICDEKRGKTLQDIVANIPLNRLLIETDAPYLLPHNLTNKPKSRRNEPCFLPAIVEQIASLTGHSTETIKQQTEANARAVFNLTQGHQRCA